MTRWAPDFASKDLGPMKLSLRVTLSATLVALILLTVLGLGYNANYNSRFTAEDLCSQILNQTARLVDTQVEDLLREAGAQGNLNHDLLVEHQFSSTEFGLLARFWISMLKSHPRLSRESLALAATGEWSFIRRASGGRLAIGELRRDAATGKLVHRDYWPEDYPRKPFNQVDDASDQDPRKFPWYLKTVAARRQVWSEAYILEDIKGFVFLPGVSCCTPIYASDGSLEAVQASSFDVISLCDFLKSLDVGEGGIAFVVETCQNGERRVIAHPDPEILIRSASVDGRDQPKELVPPKDLRDTKVAAFLQQIPETTARRTQRIYFEHKGIAYIGAYSSLSGADSPNWLICVMMPERNVMGRVTKNNRETSFVGAGILIAALLIGLFVSARLARPLERVVRETEKIGRFEVDASPVAHSIIVEVDELATVIEETKTSLRSFGKYVPTDLVRQIFGTGQEAVLGGDRRPMTISFCDLANFTTLAEKLPPEDLVCQMSDYFSRFSADIVAENGTVDKYIGDAIMAFWGAPSPSSNHAVDACVAALRNQATMEALNIQWKSAGRPELVARIGIMTGEAIVGNIGSPARLNYTAMGDCVNVASRLEGLGKYYGTRILIGEPTYLEAKEIVLARPVDWVSVKGKTEGLLIYELLAFKKDAAPDLVELVSLSERALQFYRCRKWQDALALFAEIGRLRPGDGPSELLAKRCEDFYDCPPHDDWDGVHRMANK